MQISFSRERKFRKLSISGGKCEPFLWKISYLQVMKSTFIIPKQTECKKKPKQRLHYSDGRDDGAALRISDAQKDGVLFPRETQLAKPKS